MAHNLSIKENGEAEMFSGENITPWHGLGKVVEGLLTAESAIKAAGLDWQVGLRPVFVDETNPRKVDDYQAVERLDNQKVLSICGSRYTPIQNAGAFDFFDEVVGSGQAVYTTAGALNEGRRVWIMAKITGKLFIDTRPDEEIERLILLCNSHDGTQSLTMQQVATRVVCQNTLSVAMKGATNQIKIRHTQNYKSKVDEAQRTLKIIHGYYDNLKVVLAELDKQAMTIKDMENFTEKLIPDSGDVDKKTATRTLNIRNDINVLFTRGRGNLGKTRYDAMNAVTDYCDHNRSVRVADGDDKQEARFISSTFGSGAILKQRAFNLLAV